MSGFEFLFHNHLLIIIYHLYNLGSLIRLPLPNLAKWFDEVNLFTPLRCVKRISAQIEERDSSIQIK